MHLIDQHIREWSHKLLEVPSAKLNGLPPCPYARKAWVEDKVKFSINTGLDGLMNEVRGFNDHDYEIVVWAEEDLVPMEYLDGYCDGINELASVLGKDMHLMVFHPEYDAEEAGLGFLVEEYESELEHVDYCMVFVQLLSKLDDASLYLEKSNYYEHFPPELYETLVLERRRLRNGNG